MILKRSVLNSRNLGFNEINFKLFADIQARSQKFAMRRAILVVWGLRRQPPEASGGLEAEPPALENLAFFCKNNLILGPF